MKTEKHLTPLRAIRQLCLRCCNGSAKQVRLCEINDCPGHPFRLNKNPYRKGIGPRAKSTNGRFLPGSPFSTRDFQTISAREGLATPPTRSPILVGPGATGTSPGGNKEVAIERAGKVRIQQGRNAIIITLTEDHAAEGVAGT